MIIKVGGEAVSIRSGSLTIDGRIGERSICSMQVLDSTLDKDYVRGTPVEIYDGDPINLLPAEAASMEASRGFLPSRREYPVYRTSEHSYHGGYSLKIEAPTASADVPLCFGPSVPVQHSYGKYHMTMRYRGSTAGMDIRLALRLYDGAQTYLGRAGVVQSIQTYWQQIQLSFDITSYPGAAYMIPEIYQYDAQAKSIYVDAMVLYWEDTWNLTKTDFYLPATPIYSGVVSTSDRIIKANKQVAIHQIEAVDYHYAAEKRYAARSYENAYVGEIVADLTTEYLVPEGITSGRGGYYFGESVIDLGPQSAQEGTTMTVRFRFKTTSSNTMVLMGGLWNGTFPSSVGLNITISGGRIYCLSAGYVTPSGGPLYNDGVWHEVEVYVPGTTWAHLGSMTCTIDGASVSLLGGDSISMTSFRLTLGGQIAANQPVSVGSKVQRFIGYIRDAEVVYGATTYGQWPVNDGSGVYVRDVSGNYRDGIIDVFGSGDWEAGFELAGPLLEEMVVNYVPVSQALDSLAERAGAIWWIDAEKRMHFGYPGAEPAPYTANGSNMMHDSIYLRDSNHKYRNVQVVRGVKERTLLQTETQVGDGKTQSFTVGYALAGAPNAIDISTDGTSWTTQTYGIKGLEEDKDWYWAIGDKTIVQDLADTPLPAGHQIRIKYFGEIDVILISQNTTAVALQKEIEKIGTGRVEAVTSTMGDTKIDGGLQLAASLLQKYAVQGKTINWQTKTGGLMAGQYIKIELPEYQVDDQYLIEAVRAREDGANNFIYDIQAVLGPENKSWAQFFAEMYREGESAIRLGTGTVESVIYPMIFSKTWGSGETPNLFNEVYAGSGTLPGVYACFDPIDRVRYAEVWSNTTRLIRKAVLVHNWFPSTGNNYTITYVSGYEIPDITAYSIRFYGSVTATDAGGTGLLIQTSTTSDNIGAAPWEKGPNDAWQIERTDTKGW